ncbi:MAG: hypothetical protein EPN82_13025 [Bacteroidetes bacterium]|nr:MAG: hypothetical protein EPN82_13025 [Bacteroidota bacterium]
MVREFDILLKSVKVIENGTFDEKGINTIKFTLHYPESGIKQVSTIVNMDLEDNKETEFDKEWQEKMLFRQVISGACILSIEISNAIKISNLEKLLLRAFKTLSITGIESIPVVGQVVNNVLKDSIENYFDELAKDKILKIAEGNLSINLELDDGIVPVNLDCPNEVIIQKDKFDSKGNRVTTSKQIPKGYCNAQVYLIIETRNL